MENTNKALILSDTIKFYHYYLTQKSLTPADRISHTLSILTCALQDLLTIICNT